MTPYFAKLPAAKPSVFIGNAPRVIVDARPPAVAKPVESAVVVAPPSPPTKRTHLLAHPLASKALTTLRNRQTSPAQYRQSSSQLLTLLVLEATRTVITREQKVETAQGPHVGHLIARPIVFLSVARHGLGLAHNLAELFPDLTVGVVSLDRNADGTAIEPRLHISNAPALGDSSVILFDPVVASGASAQAASNLVRRSGATDITLVCFVASLPGLSRLQSANPELKVWAGGIDQELDAKRGPVPGIGNFTERLYS